MKCPRTEMWKMEVSLYYLKLNFIKIMIDSSLHVDGKINLKFKFIHFF